MTEPSPKVATRSKETVCKYCDQDRGHPQVLKAHVIQFHEGSIRYLMYGKEEDELAFLRTQRRPR